MKYFEVFKAGNYPQGKFSKEEIQELAKNYDPSFCEAPITLDHEQKGPAYGWVDKLKEEDGTLKASFKDLSDDLKEFVNQGKYKKISVEIYRELEGKKPYLKAVSFLGASIPQGLHLKLEKQCAELAQDPSKYPTDNKIALSGSSQFTHDDSDPVGVIDDAKDAVSRQIGQDPNTLVMGQEVWESLKRNESLKGLIASTSNKIITLDLLKEFFEIENIVIGKTIYSNASNKFERVWGIKALIDWIKKILKPVDDTGGAAEKMGVRFGKAIANIIIKITELITKVFECGKKIGDMLSNGILSTVNKTKEAIGKHAQIIRDHLPHSPAKSGPLKDLKFIKGNGEYVGVFVIERIRESMEQTNAKGNIISIQLEVTLKEYAGNIPEEKNKQKGFKKKA